MGSRFGGDVIEGRGEPGFVGKRGLVDRKHAGSVADPEQPAASKTVRDPAGGRRKVGCPRRLLRLVADRPQPADGSHAFRALHAKLVGEFMPLGLIATIAPQPRRAQGLPRGVGQHFAMHLPRDTDRPHLHGDALDIQFSSQRRHGCGQRRLPIGRLLLEAFRSQAGHHGIGALGGGQDLQGGVGKDHRQALRADVDPQIAIRHAAPREVTTLTETSSTPTRCGGFA